MNSKHTSEEKQNIITAYKAGKRVSLLVTETGIPRSTIYAWLTDERAENSEKGTSFTLREYRSLENKVNRLKGIIDILQKAPCTATAPLENRLHALDGLHDQYSVHIFLSALNSVVNNSIYTASPPAISAIILSAEVFLSDG